MRQSPTIACTPSSESTRRGCCSHLTKYFLHCSCLNPNALKLKTASTQICCTLCLILEQLNRIYRWLTALDILLQFVSERFNSGKTSIKLMAVAAAAGWLCDVEQFILSPLKYTLEHCEDSYISLSHIRIKTHRISSLSSFRATHFNLLHFAAHSRENWKCYFDKYFRHNLIRRLNAMTIKRLFHFWDRIN